MKHASDDTNISLWNAPLSSHLWWLGVEGSIGRLPEIRKMRFKITALGAALAVIIYIPLGFIILPSLVRAPGIGALIAIFSSLFVGYSLSYILCATLWPAEMKRVVLETRSRIS